MLSKEYDNYSSLAHISSYKGCMQDYNEGIKDQTLVMYTYTCTLN